MIVVCNDSCVCPGGLSEISVDSQRRSPIMRSVELASCPGSVSYSLPSFPSEMFGGQAVWLGDSQTIMVCGGANWTDTYPQCYTWSHSLRRESIWENKIAKFRTSSEVILQPFLEWPNYREMQRKI